MFPKVVHALPYDAYLTVEFEDGDEISFLPKGAYDNKNRVIYVSSDVQGIEFLITLIHEFIEHLANITGLRQLHNLIHRIDS